MGTISQFSYRPLRIIQLIKQWPEAINTSKSSRMEQNLSTLSDVDLHFPVPPRAMRGSSGITHNHYPRSANAFPRHCTTFPRRINICQLHLLWSVIPSPVSKSRLKGHAEMLFHTGPLTPLCSWPQFMYRIMLHLPALSHVVQHFPINPYISSNYQ